jgi:hypothetical protein
VAVGILGGFEQGVGKIGGAGVGKAAAEDGDEILPAERLRHEVPSLARLCVAGKGGLDERRRVKFGFHGFHQVFGGVLGAALARLFFFDFADGVVDLAARGFGEGAKEFLEALGLAEFAGERRLDCHRDGETLPRMARMERIFTNMPTGDALSPAAMIPKSTSLALEINGPCGTLTNKAENVIRSPSMNAVRLRVQRNSDFLL